MIRVAQIARHVEDIHVLAPGLDTIRKDAPGAEAHLLEHLDRRHVRDAHVEPHDLDLAALGFGEEPLHDRRSEPMALLLVAHHDATHLVAVSEELALVAADEPESIR